jgi:hypothetical protein
MPRPSLTTARQGSPPETATGTGTLRRTSIRGLRRTGRVGGGKLGAALKLVAGFGLALAVVLYVEALLAVFPSPVWTTLLLLPPLAAAGLVLDSLRRGRQAAERTPRPAPLAQPATSRPSQPVVVPQRPPAEPAPVVMPAVEDPLAAAVECFNASAFPRTVAGIAKSLGPPQVSILRADGSADVLITVAWELSWYQYRVNPPAPEPVQLEDRGQELEELGAAYQSWNAEAGADGRVAIAETVLVPGERAG